MDFAIQLEINELDTRRLHSKSASRDADGALLRYMILPSASPVDAKEYDMSTALRMELGHEVRVLKPDLDHRLALLELEIDSLRRELSTAVATQRQCLYFLLGAMLFTSFCTMLAFM